MLTGVAMVDNTRERSAPLPHEQLLGILRGYAGTQLVYVAARLDLLRHLQNGARTAAALAEVADVDQLALRRVLRGLVNLGLLEELEDGSFQATQLGSALESPELRGWAILTGELFYPARIGLLDAVRTGTTCFQARFGDDFFGYLSRHPELSDCFAQGMQRETARTASALVSHFDFEPYRWVVDVGGGRGHVLVEILKAFPTCRGTLQDRAEATLEASRQLAQAGLSARSDVIERSFFDGIVEGADLYVLSWVLHDWDDETCLDILKHCREALAPRGQVGRLLVIESIMPSRLERATSTVEADLAMLVLTGGHERTEVEFAALLALAGFDLIDAQCLTSGRSLLVAAPRPC